MTIKVYNVSTDEMIEVTQVWCNAMQKSCNALASQRELIRKISALHINDTRLDKIKKILET